MAQQDFDVAVAGGGLAGGLIALALRRAHPDLSVALVEGGPAFGGNHRWSWFDSDLDPAQAALMEALPVTAVGRGNRVRFPGHERRLDASYRSLDSRDFDAALRRALPQRAVLTGRAVTELRADRVTLADGTALSAGTVIDCRGFAPTPHLSGGWQVFLGQSWRTDAPHGIGAPVIMDAAVEQTGGYRFVYVLPLDADTLFLEDTYYADSPALDPEALRGRLAAYAAQAGWNGRAVHEETGVLPVVTGGDFAAWQASVAVPGVARAGAGGGFFHPLTSYTVPIAVRTALAVAALLPHTAGPALAAALANEARAHWRATGFYRALGRMLFAAAAPDQRYRIFERFYRLPEPLIERFYAARSTPADRLRVLAGKPPVPIGRAVAALLGKGAPLVHEAQP